MCQLCESKPVWEFTNKRKLCARCFVKYFEKKFLYVMRKFGMVGKGEVIGYEKGKDFRNVVLGFLLEMYGQRAPVEIAKLPTRKATRVAVADTSDSVAYAVVREFVKGKSENLEKFAPVFQKNIRVLFLFLDAEVLLYAKIKKLKFSIPKKKKSGLDLFVDEMEKKHPEIKHAIVKGFLKISEV